MSITPDDLISAVDCRVNLTRNGDTFQVEIVGNDGQKFQELDNYTLLDGDVLSISGLGFKVTLEEEGMAPHHLIKEMFGRETIKTNPISIDLKRKMDIK